MVAWCRRFVRVQQLNRNWKSSNLRAFACVDLDTGSSSFQPIHASKKSWLFSMYQILKVLKSSCQIQRRKFTWHCTAWRGNLMLDSMRHDNERPGSKELSIQDPGFFAGPVQSSIFLVLIFWKKILRCKNLLPAASGS